MSAIELQIFVSCINTASLEFNETPPPDCFIVGIRAGSQRGRQDPERRMDHPGRRALPQAMGTIQGPAARSLVGEFRSRGAAPYRPTARRARAGRAHHLAGL